MRSLLIFASFLAFHLAGITGLPLIDRDEPRFAEAAREMMQRGDFVVPHFNGEYRFDKPPLIYWAQAACFAAFGENEFSARFPSAVFAALLAVLIHAWAVRLGLGPGHALLAAAFCNTSVQMFLHSKGSVADMPMVVAVLATTWSGWELLRARNDPGGASPVPRQAWPWAFVLTAALALGFLAKGPVAWLPVCGMVYLGFPNGPGKPDKTRLGLVGGTLVAASALVLLWAWPALSATGGDYFRVGIGKHVVQRSFDPMEGHGATGILGYLLTLPFYFLVVFLVFFPASVFLPWLLGRVRQRHSSLAAEPYLWVVIAAYFVVHTLMSTKLPHYILPAFPLLGLLLAAHFQAAGRPTSVAFKWCGATAAALVLVGLVGMPWAGKHLLASRLDETVRPLVRPETRSASSGFQEPSLVWILRFEMTGYHELIKAARIGDWLQAPGPALAFFTEAEHAKYADRVPEGIETLHVAGWNPAKGFKIQGWNPLNWLRIERVVVLHRKE